MGRHGCVVVFTAVRQLAGLPDLGVAVLHRVWLFLRNIAPFAMGAKRLNRAREERSEPQPEMETEAVGRGSEVGPAPGLGAFPAGATLGQTQLGGQMPRRQLD
jgi:hypothetical protein